MRNFFGIKIKNFGKLVVESSFVIQSLLGIICDRCSKIILTEGERSFR